MNKVILMGRLTRDPEVRWKDNDNVSANYTLAVDRRKRADDEQTADFIRVVTFQKQAEFTEKYLQKGTKILITGHIQTGSYTNRDGQKVYTTDVIAENQEFCESKNSQSGGTRPTDITSCEQYVQHEQPPVFVPIPDNVDDTGLPFN